MADPDLTTQIRAAILAEAAITALLAEYKGSPAVFTRRPTPGDNDVAYPLIVVSRNTSPDNQDWIADFQPLISYEIAVYALGDLPPEDYRAISVVGYALRDLFHRQQNLTLADWSVVQQLIVGPRGLPSANQLTTRVVTLTVHLAQQAPAS